jgi:hypothetical protein
MILLALYTTLAPLDYVREHSVVRKELHYRSFQSYVYVTQSDTARTATDNWLLPSGDGSIAAFFLV